MTRLSRILPLVLVVPLLMLTGATSAHADPVPAQGKAWPRCGSGSDTDGKYCIVSVTRDGVAVPRVTASTPPGTYDNPFVDRVDAGTVRFGIKQTTVTASGSTSVDEVSPSHTWVFTVNTGDIRPVELYGNIRDADLSLGGGAAHGRTFQVTFKPTPVAWLLSGSCSVFGGCGDDSTVADTVYSGYATAFVSDDSSAGLTAAQISDRRGYLNVFNAEDASFYDGGGNTLVMRMANPHLKSPGNPATGFFQTRIPDAMLIDELNVPDPHGLTAKSFSVVRTGSGAVPFTLTRVKGAVDIRVTGITFSTPEFTIHPKPTAPGSPRWGSLKRVSPHRVTATFRAPRADGGKPIDRYAVRCRRGTGAWHNAHGPASPITVGSVPRGTVSCQVRAHNQIGWGHWNAARSVG
jgi:hypothetical protein